MKKTFTLVELIVVIAILAILSVSAFVTLTKWFGKSRDSRRMHDVGVIITALNTRSAESTTQIVRFTTGDLTTTTPTVNTTWDVFNVPLNDDVKNGWKLDSLSKLPMDPVGKYYAIGIFNTWSKKGMYFSVAATLETNPNGDPVATSYIDGNYSTGAGLGVNYPSLIFKNSYDTTNADTTVLLNQYDQDPNIPYPLQ